jgi:hypothetical protein
MATWKFVESEGDGLLWIQNSSELHAFIDVSSPGTDGRDEWRRIMVVTRGWVERRLTEVRAESGRAVFAAMLVLPDATSSGLRAAIDAAVAAGGLDHFASPVT